MELLPICFKCRQMLLLWFSFYVAGVITTVADGIATQSKMISFWMWCVVDGITTVSKLFQLEFCDVNQNLIPYMWQMVFANVLI